MATLILTDGTESEVKPTGKTFTLDEMYALIGNGCDIVQAIELPDGRAMWMDEEAKIRPRWLNRNPKATALALTAGIARDDVIVGNVLVTGPGEVA